MGVEFTVRGEDNKPQPCKNCGQVPIFHWVKCECTKFEITDLDTENTIVIWARSVEVAIDLYAHQKYRYSSGNPEEFGCTVLVDGKKYSITSEITIDFNIDEIK